MDTPRLPPGPRFAPLQTLRFMRDINATLADCLRRYGDPFLVPLLFDKVVLTAHPDGIKEIFSADPDTFESFGSVPLEPLIGQNSLVLLSGARHKRERKLLMPPFHGERMRAYGRLMRDSVFAHTSRLRPGERVVMQELIQAVAFDVILRAVFGVEEPERIERFHRNNEALMSAVNPAYLFFEPLRRPLLPGWRRFLEAKEEQDVILQEQIDRRRQSLGRGEDILGLLLAARDEAGQPMTDRELKDELITMVAGGHDTSALSLTWSMFWLHRDPGRLTRLLDEIDALGEDPEPAALVKLPYLGAVCDETLRLSPPLDMSPRRLIRPFRLRGWDLPVGTAVAAAITATHKDPSIYPDPESFRPERFLDRKFSPFEYLPFGGGARRCIGAAFAAFEMRIVLGSLLSRHRFSLVSSVTPRMVRRHITLGPEGGVPMIYDGPRRTGQPIRASDPRLARQTILVTGATGRQGGAVARHLLNAGFTVRVLSRDPGKPAALALKQLGAEVIPGNLEDPGSLKSAVAGVHGVFSVQNFWESGVGYEGEIRQARYLVDAAKQAGVAHFVQASVADADKARGVRHFECKAEIVRYLRSIGLPHTVLGEVFHMENFLDKRTGPMTFPFLGGVLSDATLLHLISVEDVGAVTAIVFQHPERTLGKTLDIAGDRLSVPEMKEIYRKVTGKSPKGWNAPALLLRLANEEMWRQLTWNNDPGWRFDLAESRQLHPTMTTFEQFLRRHALGNL